MRLYKRLWPSDEKGKFETRGFVVAPGLGVIFTLGPTGGMFIAIA